MKLKKQPTTALSYFEAEYMVAASSACQAIWLRRSLSDMKQEQDGATLILCYNKSTIAITKNPVYHGKTKHIDIRVHFIRELVADGVISLEFCGIEKQMVDILTKSLPRSKHEVFRRQLGVCEFGSIKGRCWKMIQNSRYICCSCYFSFINFICLLSSLSVCSVC